MKPIRRWSTTASLCLFVALTGCHHVDPLVFNQTLDDDNKKLNAAGAKMGVALRGALNNQPGGVDKFKTEYTAGSFPDPVVLLPSTVFCLSSKRLCPEGSDADQSRTWMKLDRPRKCG